jgi:L-fuconolactonase
MPELTTCVIDAHHHYWLHGKRHHKWPDKVDGRLDRSFLPNDLIPEMKQAQVNGCILVQSLNDYDETCEFLHIANQYPHILGVIGWLPLNGAKETLKYFEEAPLQHLLVGVRHLINFEPDPKWLLQAHVLDSIGVLEDQNLVFDVVPVNDDQFESVIKIASAFPKLSIVIDHLARPSIGSGKSVAWSNQIHRIAQLPNVSIKLSIGLDILMGWKWSNEEMQSFIDEVLTSFGSERVMAASNWPVCTLAAQYSDVWEGIRKSVRNLSQPDQAKVLGENAFRIFSLSKSPIIN